MDNGECDRIREVRGMEQWRRDNEGAKAALDLPKYIQHSFPLKPNQTSYRRKELEGLSIL
jgi:hypothetical protein